MPHPPGTLREYSGLPGIQRLLFTACYPLGSEAILRGSPTVHLTAIFATIWSFNSCLENLSSCFFYYSFYFSWIEVFLVSLYYFWFDCMDVREEL